MYNFSIKLQSYMYMFKFASTLTLTERADRGTFGADVDDGGSCLAVDGGSDGFDLAASLSLSSRSLTSLTSLTARSCITAAAKTNSS